MFFGRKISIANKLQNPKEKVILPKVRRQLDRRKNSTNAVYVINPRNKPLRTNANRFEKASAYGQSNQRSLVARTVDNSPCHNREKSKISECPPIGDSWLGLHEKIIRKYEMKGGLEEYREKMKKEVMKKYKTEVINQCSKQGFVSAANMEGFDEKREKLFNNDNLKSYYLKLMNLLENELEASKVLASGKVSSSTPLISQGISLGIAILGSCATLSPAGIPILAMLGITHSLYATVMHRSEVSEAEIISQLITDAGFKIGKSNLLNAVAYNTTFRYRMMIRQLLDKNNVEAFAKAGCDRMRKFIIKKRVANPELIPLEFQLAAAPSLIDPDVTDRVSIKYKSKRKRHNVGGAYCRSGIEMRVGEGEHVDSMDPRRVYYYGDSIKRSIKYSLKHSVKRLYSGQKNREVLSKVTKYNFRRGFPGEESLFGLELVPLGELTDFFRNKRAISPTYRRWNAEYKLPSVFQR